MFFFSVLSIPTSKSKPEPQEIEDHDDFKSQDLPDIKPSEEPLDPREEELMVCISLSIFLM